MINLSDAGHTYVLFVEASLENLCHLATCLLIGFDTFLEVSG